MLLNSWVYWCHSYSVFTMTINTAGAKSIGIGWIYKALSLFYGCSGKWHSLPGAQSLARGTNRSGNDWTVVNHLVVWQECQEQLYEVQLNDGECQDKFLRDLKIPGDLVSHLSHFVGTRTYWWQLLSVHSPSPIITSPALSSSFFRAHSWKNFPWKPFPETYRLTLTYSLLCFCRTLGLCVFMSSSLQHVATIYFCICVSH